MHKVSSDKGVECIHSSFIIKEEDVTFKFTKDSRLLILDLHKNLVIVVVKKIDKIIKNFGLGKNYKYFTQLKTKGLRQTTYSKVYLKEMLDVVGLVNERTWRMT